MEVVPVLIYLIFFSKGDIYISTRFFMCVVSVAFRCIVIVMALYMRLPTFSLLPGAP